jgi:DNA-binding MarR family transcriptional regulator
VTETTPITRPAATDADMQRGAPAVTDVDHDVAAAIEGLRLAEAQLARRRQTTCGPSETDRRAARLVYERADAGAPVSPNDVAAFMGLSSAATTQLLDRLERGHVIDRMPHPTDRRRKLLVPTERRDARAQPDPLTEKIRELAGDLPVSQARAFSELLRAVTDDIDAECR